MANVTVTVLEADGVTETDCEVLGFGRQAASASKSTAMSTEDKAVLDAAAASLVSILAKIIAAPATEAKQDTAITALQLIDDAIFVDDAAFTIGTSKVMAIGFQADESSTDSIDEGDIGAPRMTLDRKVIFTNQPHITGGLSVFRSLDLDESEEEVKSSAGCLYKLRITNRATTARYIKLYDANLAGTTVGSTTPIDTIVVPGASSADLATVLTENFGGIGLTFATALCLAATTGLADADTGAPSANDVVATAYYKVAAQMHMIMTPSGYRDASTLQFGDEVCAFDRETGAPIINTLEAKPRWIDAVEWERWWQVEDEVPPFQFVRVNGTWLFNSEQSIWRNGTNVCHARHLVVGDTIYDDENNDVEITSIGHESADGWWLFHVSGDHSYIIDGLTVHNANRHWVGGTGTWDSSSTTNWSGAAGGANGSSVPGAADNVTFSSSSGGGTCTLNFGGTITITFITHNTYTGTFDNSVNNNNMTFSQTGQAWNNSGSGVRTLKLGTATYTLTDNAAVADHSGANMTYTGNTGANWVFTGTSGARQFVPGTGLAHGNVTFAASTGGGYCILDDGASSSSINSLSVTAPNYLRVNTVNTITITNALTIAGTSSNQITIVSGTHATQANIAVAGGSTFDWCSFRDINFTTGSPTASNSFNSLNNSGITITAPTGGATAVARVIGG